MTCRLFIDRSFSSPNPVSTSLCSLEQRNLELETEMVSLHEELDQERKKYTMAEIKLRNAERAKDDAERRNQTLQKEMEQFFSTFSDLTATGSAAATDPRRPDRNNAIWIQWGAAGVGMRAEMPGKTGNEWNDVNSARASNRIWLLVVQGEVGSNINSMF